MATQFLKSLFESDLVQRIAADDFGRKCAAHVREVANMYPCVVERHPDSLSFRALIPKGGLNVPVVYDIHANGGVVLALTSSCGKEVQFTSAGYGPVKCGVRAFGYGMNSGAFEERVAEAAGALYN